MTAHSGPATTLADLPPAALHALECADGRLRHSAGLRALGALKTLASLAPKRMDRPGFRQKLDAARAGARLARGECAAFFAAQVLPGITVGDVSPLERDEVMARLDALEGLPLDALARSIDQLLVTLTGITRRIQARRRSVRALIEEEASRLAGLCEGGRVLLVTRLATGEDRPVFVDPRRISDALGELVTNAVRHAFDGQGGTVCVEVGEGASPNEVVLAVADDGRGIPPRLRDRLFDRGASTTGSGEGLALVREIVEEEHLGRLTYTTGDAGTRWEIALPIRVPRERLRRAASWATAPEEAGDAPPAGRGWRARLLFVAALVAVGLYGLYALVDGQAASRPRQATSTAETTPGAQAADGLPTEIVHEATGIRLVLVPAGEFTMGSDGHRASEAPARRVVLTRPFYLGKYEVTQAQYEAVMGENPSRFRGGSRPVENVSFHQALAFCRKTGLRLPTEAQWEAAAQSSPRPEGPASATCPVERTPANELGLRGMLGNAAEWCSDWFDLYPPGDAADPMGPPRGDRRVVRGGAYLDEAARLRPTSRDSLAPGDRRDFVGFRVALDVEDAQ
ncbi:MAG: SUMF1/EgtB/PvdO family nonheme iron enzyme [Candidatus Brocadiia bacterium]